jgi:hypothetical protein
VHSLNPLPQFGACFHVITLPVLASGSTVFSDLDRFVIGACGLQCVGSCLFYQRQVNQSVSTVLVFGIWNSIW